MLAREGGFLEPYADCVGVLPATRGLRPDACVSPRPEGGRSNADQSRSDAS